MNCSVISSQRRQWEQHSGKDLKWEKKNNYFYKDCSFGICYRINRPIFPNNNDYQTLFSYGKYI